MEENNQVTELQIIQAKQAAEFAMTPVGQTVKQFEVMQRMANMYTTSTIVPDTYKGNVGNCVIALDMAMRMGCNPLMCMQNLYIVHGNPAFSSKFLIATINASGRFSPLRYEFKGEEGTPEYGCRCIAYESSDKDQRNRFMVTGSPWEWLKRKAGPRRTVPNGNQCQARCSVIVQPLSGSVFIARKSQWGLSPKRRQMTFRMPNMRKLLINQQKATNLPKSLQKPQESRITPARNNRQIKLKTTRIINLLENHCYNGNTTFYRMVP